ncbi:MAG: HupE/UreJ family protein [Burkholderiales bacterium]
MRLVLFLAAAATAIPALAHNIKLSSSKLELAAHGARAHVELNGADLEAAAGVRLLGPDGSVSAERLNAQRDAVTGYVLKNVQLLNRSTAACPARVRELQASREHVLLQVEWICPPMTGELVYRATLFHEVDPAARHMIVVSSGGTSRLGLLSVAVPSMTLSATHAGTGEVLWHYFVAGLEHIAIGYDHIAFLLAVILWGRRFWPLVAVVTSFTLAHSITLGLSVLEVFTLPTRWVELLIAVSIIYVAAENFLSRDIAGRWRLTFFFGLLHGFGFAAALREYGLPTQSLAAALAAFNVGVEAGQLAIVLAAIVAFAGMRRVALVLPRMRWEMLEARAGQVISGSILALGVYWLGERFWA